MPDGLKFAQWVEGFRGSCGYDTLVATSLAKRNYPVAAAKSSKKNNNFNLNRSLEISCQRKCFSFLCHVCFSSSCQPSVLLHKEDMKSEILSPRLNVN